jgi:hypothetical protein
METTSNIMNPWKKTSLIKAIAPGGAITSSLKPDEQIWFRRKTYLKMALFITSFTTIGLIILFLST